MVIVFYNTKKYVQITEATIKLPSKRKIAQRATPAIKTSIQILKYLHKIVLEK